MTFGEGKWEQRLSSAGWEAEEAGAACLCLNTGAAPGRAGRAGESFKPVVWESAVIFRNQFC